MIFLIRVTSVADAGDRGDLNPLDIAGKHSKSGLLSPHQPTWATVRSLLESIPHVSVTERPSKTGRCTASHGLEILSSFPTHQRPSPCSHCLYTPPVLLINTTLVPRTGSAHSEWKIMRQTSHLVEYPQQLKAEQPDANTSQQSQQKLSPEHGTIPSTSPTGPLQTNTVSGKIPLKHEDHVANIAVQASADLANESTQVSLSDLEDHHSYQSMEEIIPVKKTPVARGRGRGRRGRGGGGGRQKRGTRAVHVADESRQTRSFRPRKSTCYLELPDEDEDDDNDDAEKREKKATAKQESESEEKETVSEKKHKKMRKRAHSLHHKSQLVEREETSEESDALHGKNPFILKLAKKTDSGAEWKVETVNKGEEQLDSSIPQRGKVEGQRVRAVSTDGACMSEREPLSYSCSLSDSDIAKSPRRSSNFEDIKSGSPEADVSGLDGAAAPPLSPTKRRPRGPYSKLLIAKKRRMLMQPKKGGALFRKAMKVCSVKSKMQPLSSAKAQCPSPKETPATPPVLQASKPELLPPSGEDSKSPGKLPPSGEDSKPVAKLPPPNEDLKPFAKRSAIFTLDNKGSRGKAGRVKERRKTDDSLVLSKGKYKCNRCDGHFQTQLAAKKHWLNFHHVPGGSTSPSRDISFSDVELEPTSYAPDAPNPIIPRVRPATPPLPPLPSFQSLPPVPALHPISSAPYAVPAPAPSISPFLYTPSTTRSETFLPSLNQDTSSKPTAEPEQQAPLDLPVRFLDTL